MPLKTDPFINLMSDNVQSDYNKNWFNKLSSLFDHSNTQNLYSENIAHLILYATDRVKFNDITNLLSKAFPESLIIIKCEHTNKGTVTAVTGTEEATINKRTHYHCYITYSANAGVNIHKSFKSKVREMLKNDKSKNRFMLKPSGKNMKPIDSVRPYKFTGYNIVTDNNNYDSAHLAEWDVFYGTTEARRSAYFNGTLGNKCVVKVTHSNCFRVMNWIAYGTKNKTSKGRKNFIIIDNRETLQRAA
ncbi:hypothetical protein [Pseudoalteromonas sp. Ps84H-4]|uniref:hypothetical protein n=1 Tax=Pseudoalteromonas sp. Ps84H-4 TaxID=2954502 RepID=UPI0020968927|nr:hypothetical protein [Pseudoalteromonas sp. Ps84H-4]MCO7251665.1 hypothetical protein [Pseudoalteromonas sp. Ps84H-4]